MVLGKDGSGKSRVPRVVLHGATGRMGEALFRMCEATDVPIVGAVAHRDSGCVGEDLGVVHGRGAYGVQVMEDVGAALLGADVVIDFSHPSAFEVLVREAQRARVALVSGTTGFGDGEHQRLAWLSQTVPVLWASNFSLGLAVLKQVVELAARRLCVADNEDRRPFDVEVVETHHRNKRDAPSGTALTLAAVVQQVLREGHQREADPSEPVARLVHGRQGLVGERHRGEIGVHAVRGGDVVGDHQVHLLGLGERLELTHRATSRDVFARGALFAARAIAGRGPGQVELADLL